MSDHLKKVALAYAKGAENLRGIGVQALRDLEQEIRNLEHQRTAIQAIIGGPAPPTSNGTVGENYWKPRSLTEAQRARIAALYEDGMTESAEIVRQMTAEGEVFEVANQHLAVAAVVRGLRNKAKA